MGFPMSTMTGLNSFIRKRLDNTAAPKYVNSQPITKELEYVLSLKLCFTLKATLIKGFDIKKLFSTDTNPLCIIII